MGSKLRGNRLESELDRSRTEGNWQRAAELAKAAKSRQSGLSSDQIKLVEAESAIEAFLETHDVLTPKSSYAADLRSAEDKLCGLLLEDDKSEAVVMLEARLILAKAAYARADSHAAMTFIDDSGMDKGNMPFRTLRSLRLVAEAYAIKGLCMDQKESLRSPSTSVTSDRDRSSTGGSDAMDPLKRQRLLASFEKAAELTISYVVELEKAFNPMRATTGTSTGSLQRPKGPGHERIGDILEYALERVARLRLRDTPTNGGNQRKIADEGIEWYRRIMTCLGDKSTGERLQMRLSRQFAELLLRAIPETGVVSKAMSTKTESLDFYSGAKVHFCPVSKLEEIILLLLLSEALCTKDIVLGRTDEVPPWQVQAITTAKAVYNLLTLILTSLRQFGPLSSIFERAMKFANDDPFLWQQFSLSVVCRGLTGRALRVLERSMTISHSHKGEGHGRGDDRAEATTASQHLVAAQLYLDQRNDPQKAVEHANAALALARGGILRGRAMLLKAISVQQRALSATGNHQRRLDLFRESGFLLEECVSVDPHDYLALYYTALHYAHVRDLGGARERLARSLELNSEQPAALLLLALIFSAERDFKGAMEVVKNALDDYPSNYALRVLQLHLFIKLGRVSDSMESSVALLELWSTKHAAAMDKVSGAENGLDSSSSVHRAGSRETVYSSPAAAGSHNGFDVSDSGVFPASASEMGAASSQSETSALPSISGSTLNRFRAQASIWVALAELFLSEGRLQEVQPCVEQAIALFPWSHHALYLKGRLLLARSTLPSCPSSMAEKLRAEARGALLSSLSLMPEHVPSMESLAILYKADGNASMAEHMYRELVRVEPLEGRWWHELGDALVARGRAKEAVPCLTTAARLERASPILPFEAIPLVFPSSF